MKFKAEVRGKDENFVEREFDSASIDHIKVITGKDRCIIEETNGIPHECNENGFKLAKRTGIKLYQQK